MHKILFAAALALLVVAPSRALAADKSRAREAYQSASQHYNLSEFAEALHDFKEAYRNFADPTILFNIAQCQRQLGAKQEAIYSYRAYLREAPSSTNRADVQQLIAGLEAALHEEASSKARPPGGTLPPQEATPAKVAVEPGPAAPAETVAPAATVSVPSAAMPAPPAKTPLYKKWWLWTAVGAVVVVGLGVGLGVGLSQSSGGNVPIHQF